jgi:hypothetical protein
LEFQSSSVVYVASKAAQTVSAVAVVVRRRDHENVFVLPNPKLTEQIITDTVNSPHLTNLNTINETPLEEEVSSLCPKDLSTNVSAMKNKV